MPSSSSAARSAPRRAPNTYAPPTPLEDLHILDDLELAGSQYKAARALEMHQTTVCRSLQLMQRQFSLIHAPGSAICRHGHRIGMECAVERCFEACKMAAERCTVRQIGASEGPNPALMAQLLHASSRMGRPLRPREVLG